MFALALSPVGWFARPAELRIDVRLHPDDVGAELEKLHRRFRCPGDCLYGIEAAPGPAPGLVFRHRESDGEHYVYVEDVAHRRLAGYTVFNRVPELSRQADPQLRAPHSRYETRYQRRGIARAVYQWALVRGMCLISGPRQSAGAHALWNALAKDHERGYVELRDKRLRWLGSRVAQSTFDEFQTRMALLGEGWSVDRLMRAAGTTALESNGEGRL